MAAARARERGAVAVIVAMLATVVIGSGAFAVDLGMQRVTRSDAQAVADVVALDLARDLDGTNNGTYFDSKWAQSGSTLQQSLNRNTTSIGHAPTPPTGWLCNAEVCATAVAGHINSSNGNFVSDTTAIPTAVQVTVQGVVGFGLAKAFGVGSGSVTRTAVGTSAYAPPSGCTGTCTPAQTVSSACTTFGTYLASLDTSNSAVLNSVLNNELFTLLGISGQSVSFQGVGYEGLAGVGINLLSIATQLNLGTVNGLLNDQSLSVGQLLDASITVLQNQSPTLTATQLGVLGALKLAVDRNATLYNQFIVGQSGDGLGALISVGSNDTAAGLSLNFLDLLGLIGGGISSTISNGNNFVNTGITLSVANLSSLSVQLAVIEPPKIGCYGATDADTGQVKLRITGNLLNIAGVSAGVLETDIDLAHASGNVTALTCNTSNTPTGMTDSVTDDSLLDETVSVTGLKVGGIGNVLSVTSATTPQSGSWPSSVSLSLPTNYTGGTPYTINANGGALPSIALSVSLISGQNSGVLSGLLNSLVNTLLSPVVSALNVVISGLNTAISSTVAPALGLNLAGVDIWADKTPSCGTIGLGG